MKASGSDFPRRDAIATIPHGGVPTARPAQECETRAGVGSPVASRQRARGAHDSSLPPPALLTGRGSSCIAAAYLCIPRLASQGRGRGCEQRSVFARMPLLGCQVWLAIRSRRSRTSSSVAGSRRMIRMVSSPANVPRTSGHSSQSIPAATVWAPPFIVRTTSR